MRGDEAEVSSAFVQCGIKRAGPGSSESDSSVIGITRAGPGPSGIVGAVVCNHDLLCSVCLGRDNRGCPSVALLGLDISGEAPMISEYPMIALCKLLNSCRGSVQENTVG